MEEAKFIFKTSYKLILFLIVANLLIFLFSWWSPVALLAAIPLIIMVCLGKMSWAVLVTCLASLLAWFLTGNSLFTMIYLLEVGLAGLFMGILFKKNISGSKIILLSGLFSWIAVVILLGVTHFYYQIDLWQYLKTLLSDSLENSSSFYKSLGLKPEELAQYKNYNLRLLKIVEPIWPSLLFVFCFSFVYLDYVISMRILRPSAFKLKEVMNFSAWRWPDWLIWGFILSSAVLVGKEFLAAAGLPLISRIGQNGLVIFSFLYLVQGLSIISFYLRRSKVGALAKILFYFLLMIQTILWPLLIILGIMDTWINWRKFAKSH